jgi:type I restriction enzyme, S subunit
MNEWLTLPFSEAVLINPSVPLKRGTVYPFVDMQSVVPNNKKVRANEKRVFDGGGARFLAGDVLMARITPSLEHGKISRFAADDPDTIAHGSTEFIVIRGKPEVTDTDFAYYLTRWDYVRQYAISQMTGSSGRQRVPTDSLQFIEVAIPPLSEQRAIANILGSLDDKIELNRRMNTILEELARVVFRKWFVEHEESEDWQVQTLEQHIEAEKGLSYKGEGLSNDIGTPMHNLNSVYEGGGYKYEGIKYYTGEYRERHILRAGEIIVTNTEQGFEYLLIGYPAIVPKYFGTTGIFSHHIFRVRPLPASPLKTHYLYFLLMDPFVRDQIVGCTNGTTVNMLSADGLRNPKFKLPPKELIDRFELFAAPIFEKKELLYKESHTLANLRDTLLPKLMRGEVSVKE